jgi:O-antigen ligase
MENRVVTISLILLNFAVLFIFPFTKVLDIDTWRLLLFSSINSISLVYIFAVKDLSVIFNEILKSKISLAIGAFILWGLISYFYAVNPNAVLMRVFTFINFYISFLSIYTFIKFNKIKNMHLCIFILAIVSIQLTSSYNAYFDIISSVKYNFSFNTYLQGFFPNRNITSAIYLTQLPFIIYIIIESKSKFLKVYSSFISFALLYMVFMLGSRTAYVILLFLTIFYFIIFFINKHEQVKKHLLVFGLSLIASLSLSLFTLGSNNDAFFVNRVQTIDFEETSTNTRLRYYSHGFNQLISSPIFGVGLGNWKIVSIERDKDNIESYIIPYTMHNDFLEVGAELGLIGLVIFISIYFFALRDCWNIYNKSKNNPLFILLPGVILIYLIDANLNFAVFLSISTYLNKTDENNN